MTHSRMVKLIDVHQAGGEVMESIDLARQSLQFQVQPRRLSREHMMANQQHHESAFKYYFTFILGEFLTINSSLIALCCWTGMTD